MCNQFVSATSCDSLAHLRDGVLQLLGCLADFIELLDLEDPVARGAFAEHEGGGLLACVVGEAFRGRRRTIGGVVSRGGNPALLLVQGWQIMHMCVEQLMQARVFEGKVLASAWREVRLRSIHLLLPCSVWKCTHHSPLVHRRSECGVLGGNSSSA